MRALMFYLAAILVLSVSESQAINQGAYIVKAREITTITEAIKVLLQFMPKGMPIEEKCERYAVLLVGVSRTPVDQFQIAELGLARKDAISKRYARLEADTLRQLYIDGIEEFHNGQLNEAVVDLVECLSRKFGAYDARARSFLNRQDIKTSLQQFKAVLEQPIEFLLNPDLHHPTLSLNQLTPSVQRSVLKIFRDNKPLFESKFTPINRAPVKAAGNQYSVASASASSGPQQSGAQAQHEPVSRPSQPNQQRAPAPQLEKTAPVRPTPVGQQQQPTKPTPVQQAPAQQAPAQQAPIKQAQAKPAPVQPQQQPARPAPAQQVPVQTAPAQPEPAQSNQQQQQQDPEYLKKLASSFESLHTKLPVESKLGNRCMAYEQVLATDPESLNANTVEEIIAETVDVLKENGPIEEVFTPAQGGRDLFLMAMRQLGPEKLGKELYLDFIDCAFNWDEKDERVDEYLEKEAGPILDKLAE